MTRYLRTHALSFVLAAIALLLAIFKPSLTGGLAALPFAFGSLLSNDDAIKYLIALGLVDANGLFYSFLRSRQQDITGNVTVSILDSGKTFYVRAVDAVVTLPAAAAATAGCRLTFIMTNAGLSAGTGLSLSPSALDFITSHGLTQTDNKDLILAGASDDEGDMITIECDGVDGWYPLAISGTWAKEA